MDKYYEMAERIHSQNIAADSHLDLGGIIYNRRKLGDKNVLKKYFLDSFRKGGFRLIVAVVFIDTEYTDMALKLALRQINLIKEEIKMNSDDCMLVRNNKDLEELYKTDKIGFILSLEGAEPIGRELDLLDTFYELGVRGLGLVWSRRNYVADGMYFRDPEEGIKGGLTPFGIEVVRRAKELGIWLDVSHLNDPGVYDLFKFSDESIMASHSNSRKLGPMLRNMPDDIIEELIARDGYIGINVYKGIVSPNKEDQTLEKVVDHIEYMIDKGGIDCVGFGFDLCRMFYDPNEKIDVLFDHGEAILISAELLRRGHTEEEIVKIIGGNFIKYISSIIG